MPEGGKEKDQDEKHADVEGDFAQILERKMLEEKGKDEDRPGREENEQDPEPGGMRPADFPIALFHAPIIPDKYLSRKSRQVLLVFLISKREIFRKVKKVKKLRGGVLDVRRTRNFAGCHRDCGKGPF
jgi:hypothetical protein